MTKGSQSFVLLLMAGAVAIGLTLWRMGLMPLPGADVPMVASVEKAPEPPAMEPAEAVKYPLESAPRRSVSGDELARAVTELLGRDAVSSFLYLDDFPRRLVATLDNLARSHAPQMLWPVAPAPGRFVVDDRGGRPVMGADNGARYTPFVLMAESIDPSRAADLYVRIYPLLQRTYEEQGFSGRYLNDRVMAVIDLLLATPEPQYPVALELMEVKGPIPSLRPWTRYEFADPALESLSAGQKILVRAGPVNQRRLKAKLAEFRAELVKRAPRR